MAKFAIEDGVLQGDLEADNFTILNLDLTGLGLTKSSVGLGNVDDTADLDKPISNATAAALALKEPAIPAGLTTQFLIGDKTWQTYGSLALENAVTTKPLISVIGAAANSSSVLSAKRNDFQSSTVSTSIQQLGASVLGNVLSGVPGANVGMLVFEGDAFGVIKTTNSAPIIFGTNSLRRMRLEQGLNVGGDTDPGVGCISANGTITASLFSGDGHLITGIVKGQIPATLNATVMPSLAINGVGGAGYLSLGSQTSAPSTAAATLYANNARQISFHHCGLTTLFDPSFEAAALTANRVFSFLDVTGSLPVLVSAPASAGASGKAGSIAYDATHLYICRTTDTWIRASFAAW